MKIISSLFNENVWVLFACLIVIIMMLSGVLGARFSPLAEPIANLQIDFFRELGAAQFGAGTAGFLNR